MTYYAAIAEGEVSEDAAQRMSSISAQLAMLGWVLRSGSDMPFEQGARVMGGGKIIRCPTIWKPATGCAAYYCDDWKALDEREHARRASVVLSVLGDDLNTPAGFVLSYNAPFAVIVAERNDVPVFKLEEPGADVRLWEWLT